MFFLANDSAFCACVKAIFWSNLSERICPFVCVGEAPDVRTADVSEFPNDSFPSRTNHRVAIARYYINLCSTRRRTLQYYRSAHRVVTKSAYL